MSPPTKLLAGFRFAAIRQGDTLQRIALRELGDATSWIDLIVINDLVPPYLTGDPAAAGPRVKLYGESLIVPASALEASPETDPALVFGRDLALNKGHLGVSANGDLALVSGEANLRQAFKNRLETSLKELTFHPDYGNGARDLLGQGGDTGNLTLAAAFVRSALASDPRTKSVDSSTAALSGDSITIDAQATPVVGSSVDISTTVG